MTKVYLIRHAEAEGNLYRVAQGHDNSNLTDRGWRQVRALEKRFAPIPIDAVYASDLYRTCATAGALYRSKGLALHRRRDLREICVGEWEQKSWGEIARTDDGQLENFSMHPERWQVPGGEPPAQVQARIVAAAKQIAQAHSGQTVALVSHAYAIRLLLAAAQGIALEDLAQTPLGDNTAVSLLEYEDGVLRVVFRDDNSHLRSAEYLAGEKACRRSVGLEAGLYFRPLRQELEAEFSAVLEACREGSEEIAAFEPAALLAAAQTHTTLLGFLRDRPVGAVQLEAHTGRISLLCVRPEDRRNSFGVQLLGQAVLSARRAGSEVLRIRQEQAPAAASFLRDHGFLPAADGLLEKHIGFDPEYLSGE